MMTKRFAGITSAAAILVAAAALLYERPVAAQPASNVLRAEAIELVDARGRVRAQLNVEASGEVVFRLRDSSGTIRVKLGASDDGSGLLLANEATEPGVHMLATRSRTSVTVKRGERSRVIAP
jgi:hypothetical protein